MCVCDTQCACDCWMKTRFFQSFICSSFIMCWYSHNQGLFSYKWSDAYQYKRLKRIQWYVFHVRFAVIQCIIPLERALILDNVCHISELLIYNICIWDTVYTLLIMNVLCLVWPVIFQTDHEMTLLLLAWTSMAV